MINEIYSLHKNSNFFKSHRYIALLSAIEYSQFTNSNKIFFDNEYIAIYNKYYKKYSLTNEVNRPYIPFFHLRSTSFWNLVPNEGMEEELANSTTVASSGVLKKLVFCALFSDKAMNIISNDTSRNQLINSIISILHQRHINKTPTESQSTLSTIMNRNHTNICFSSYLNTLHKLGGANKNALSEHQATNADYKKIHTAHPQTEILLEKLKSGDSIILTGHAGDGKTSIIFDLLKLIAEDESQIDAIDLGKSVIELGKYIFIKDWSEIDSEDERRSLVRELIANKAKTYLIAGNTGALLDMLKVHHKDFGYDTCTLAETSLLNAIQTIEGSNLRGADHLDKNIFIFNLAKQDNLGLAKKIFTKMLSEESWKDCSDCDKSKVCPVLSNVELIRSRENLVINRLFLAYRRLYAYGKRLTMRQITEHMAFMITGGLSYNILPDKGVEESDHEGFYFYNSFLGNTNKFNELVSKKRLNTELPLAASELAAIRVLKEQDFSQQFVPSLERDIWSKHNTPRNKLVPTLPESIHSVFQKKVRLSADLTAKSSEEPNNLKKAIRYQTLVPSADSFISRISIRCLLYFLSDFSFDTKLGDRFIQTFLHSPGITQWMTFQQLCLEGKEEIGTQDRKSLCNSISRVLQEIFSGIRLVGKSIPQLKIGLNMEDSGNIPIVQILQATVPCSDASIKLEKVGTMSFEGECDFVMVYKPDRRFSDNVSLILKLPFFDYIKRRELGEINGTGNHSFLQQVDAFKSTLIEEYGNTDDIQIMELQADSKDFKTALIEVQSNNTLYVEYN